MSIIQLEYNLIDISAGSYQSHLVIVTIDSTLLGSAFLQPHAVLFVISYTFDKTIEIFQRKDIIATHVN